MQGKLKPTRVRAVIVEVIPRRGGYAFAFLADGGRVYVKREHFRDPESVTFDPLALLRSQNLTLIGRGAVIEFVKDDPPAGKNLPEALDVILVPQKQAEVA